VQGDGFHAAEDTTQIFGGTTRAHTNMPAVTTWLAVRSRTWWTSPVRTSRIVKPAPRRTQSISYTDRSMSSHCSASSRSSSGSNTPRVATNSANAPPSNRTVSVTSGSSSASSTAWGSSTNWARTRAASTTSPRQGLSSRNMPAF
jgi:hypothetical protein